METNKRIVNEPSFLIREAARAAMRGRMGVLIISAAIYMICINLPILVAGQLTGFWDTYENAIDDYLAILANGSNEADLENWMETYSAQNANLISYVILLIVPGPLTLGLSTVWLRVLRGQDAYADMVFSGFGNFLRATLLHVIRSIFMALWAVLFIIPGIVVYYRYIIAFYLLADNPGMSPFTALSLSKYYMRQNKGSRFALDLSFIGWFALSVLVLFGLTTVILDALAGDGNTVSFFTSQLVSSLLSAVVMAPVCVYRNIAAAEYYHRVTCQNPRNFKDRLQLPGD